MRIRFGNCSLDLDTGELLREGKPVSLSSRASSLLAVLLERRPRPVAREELWRALWPDAPTPPEGSLAAVVLELRGAIEERGEDEPIRKTSDPDGYAFVEKAFEDRRPRIPGVGYRYRLFWDDREIPLAEGDNVIGRDPAAEVLVDDAKVSRRHARIRIEGDEAVLEDLASRNGTFRNGEKIEKSTVLADGDEISLGRVYLVFRISLPKSD